MPRRKAAEKPEAEQEQEPKKRRKRKQVEEAQDETPKKKTRTRNAKVEETAEETLAVEEGNFSVKIVNSALESIDLSDYGFYVIVQQGEKFVGVDVRSDMNKIVCHAPIKGSSKTKEFEFTVTQFLDMLEKSPKAKTANKKAKKNSTSISDAV